MAQTASDPTWSQQGDAGIVLAGSWSLLVDRRLRRRLLRGLEHLGPADANRWDLTHVDALDSTGVLVLWKAWNGRLPERLDCSDEQRHVFERLADTPPLGAPVTDASAPWLDRLGSDIVTVLNTGGGMLVLAGQLMLDFAYCVRHPRSIPWREISANIYRIGATAMVLLGSIGFLVGGVMTIQVGLMLKQFHVQDMVMGMMSTAGPRELGAMITGLLMAGRSGSAMTASIGAMHMTEEYSALKALGSSPSLRLALPRVIGAGIALPLLVVWTDCTAMLGSAIAAQMALGIDYRLFLEQAVQQMQLVNFWIGLGKGAVFGLVIALIGCYFGMTAAPDSESISRNTTASVVTSLTLVLLIDASLGAALTNVGLLQ